MKQGQQIIFKHPESGAIYAGFVTGLSVSYRHGNVKCLYPRNLINEWADAEEAFYVFALHVRVGCFPEGC